MRQPAAARPRRRFGRKVLRTALPVVLVALIFWFALPRFASYGGVWASIGAMTWPQALLIAVAAAGSMVASWIVICSALPSVRLREAAAANLGSSAVANTLPAGGALAMGVSWAMLSGWGISTADYVLYTLVSGIWNVFARLVLPVVALLVMVTVTPGGIGITELGLVGILAAGAGHRATAQVTAAVLLYRAVTYLPPIPLGAVACLAWRHAPTLIRASPHTAGAPSSAAQPAEITPPVPAR